MDVILLLANSLKYTSDYERQTTTSKKELRKTYRNSMGLDHKFGIRSNSLLLKSLNQTKARLITVSKLAEYQLFVVGANGYTA